MPSLSWVCMVLLSSQQLCCGATSSPADLEGVKLPACRLLEEPSTGAPTTTSRRIIAIGDVHGSNAGLREILVAAQVIDSIETCIWSGSDANKGTILVQMGDIVDRGDEALEAWECLDELSATKPADGDLIRLVGNHEVWWLENKFHMRNSKADTQDKVLKLVRSMKSQITNGELVGAKTIWVKGVPLMFVHAGYRATFLEASRAKGATALAEELNAALVDAMSQCSRDWKACPFDRYGELFEAGPERGGKFLGGPVWSDFAVLKADDLKNGKGHSPQEFIQVVGHSAAHCDDGDDSNGWPDLAHCGPLIRVTEDIESICVDGGMYQGTRSFLAVNTSSGALLAHEKDAQGLEWTTRQLNSFELCLTTTSL